MKPEDLFIGAWVAARKWPEKPFKVTEITGTFIGPFFFKEIIPIPITSEILEKNGFKCCDNITKDEFMPFVLDGMGRIIPYEVIIKWRDSYDNGAFDAFNHVSWGESWTLHCNCGVRTFDIEGTKTIYVHELQAAMRLCGIKKEIIL